ncbi:PucR family transcriptional regulator [Nocardiopsis eucommiae]|uniref:PucR family transcriptional regulator n=1 Tax=Nocardiopsis eucommiae TaxID=2831970 RepID=UPI003D74E7C2
MSITVRDITASPHLEVTASAGRSGLDRVVRWAHVTELPDPVRWLRGGELVLTAGLGLGGDPEGHRAYVRRLHGAGCAGLAFAIDIWLNEIPPEVLDEGDRLGFPVLRVEGETSFVAVVETVADHYAAERTRAQGRVLAAQDAMARAALRSGPAGVLRELASATSGECLLLDRNAMTSRAVPEVEPAWHSLVRAEVLGAAPTPGMRVLTDDGASILLQTLGTTGRTLGWVALRCAEPSPNVRVLANHAASLLAVHLLHSRDARRAIFGERAPLLRAAALGQAVGVPLALPPPPWEVVCFRTSAPGALDDAADALVDVLGDTEAARSSGLCRLGEQLLAVLPDTGRPYAGERLLALIDGVSAAGACRARGPGELASAVARARGALPSEGYRHVDEADAWALLRSTVPESGSRAFTEAVLGPVVEHDARNGTDLAHTLLHYLDSSAHVEETARELGVHRNTLRARLRTAERVLGRDLGDPRTRLELWTALSLRPMRCVDGVWHD